MFEIKKINKILECEGNYEYFLSFVRKKPGERVPKNSRKAFSTACWELYIFLYKKWLSIGARSWEFGGYRVSRSSCYSLSNVNCTTCDRALKNWFTFMKRQQRKVIFQTISLLIFVQFIRNPSIQHLNLMDLFQMT